MTRIDLNAINLFVTAARAGSLSKAARSVGQPLPTVSRKIRQLEHDLGLRLFERSSKGLVLTNAGTRLLANAEPAIGILSQSVQGICDVAGIAGTLRLSVPPHMRPLWPVLLEFRDRYPAVHLEILVTNRHVDMIEDGIDVVLRIGESGGRNYVGRTLTRYRHKVLTAPNFLDTQRINTPSDLEKAVTACWQTDGPPAWILGDTSVQLNPIMMTNDYEHLLQLALDGQAIVEVPPFMAKDALTTGRLVEVLPDKPMPLRDIRLLVIEKRELAPLIRGFFDFASKAIPEAL
ncbi:LysR family transcriptional regulator [Labrenzia sp. DG1229]|uniref:LysR family transcriptional regulator n=1 Tax=Labrenzia sp. DG1229 TaxID=681847 RepID=UPI00068C3080|nr:LysR family transcriptional regulator [Labrenzia sp. DG1229]